MVQISLGAANLKEPSCCRRTLPFLLRSFFSSPFQVEFQVVGMHDLSEADYKRVDEVFGARKEEVAASKAMIEEELKREALNAVREKMRQSSPVTKEEPSAGEQKHQRKFEPIEDIELDEQCDSSCSFWGSGISGWFSSANFPVPNSVGKF